MQGSNKADTAADLSVFFFFFPIIFIPLTHKELIIAVVNTYEE